MYTILTYIFKPIYGKYSNSIFGYCSCARGHTTKMKWNEKSEIKTQYEQVKYVEKKKNLILKKKNNCIKWKE